MYIKGIQSERKIFLVLIHLFEHASYFNNFPQIQSIYALEENPQDVQYEKSKHSKLISIFTDEQKLIKKLRQDIVLTFRDDFPINTSCLKEMKNEQSLISLDNATVMFLWNLVFTYYLFNPSDTDMGELKKIMINQSQLEYKNDPKELVKINQFDSEGSYGNVLQWYTKDSFAY